MSGEQERMRYSGQFRPEFSRLHKDRDLLWVVPFRVRYVVAITGARFAGKSTALNYLAEKRAFAVYSLSNELRQIAIHRGLPLEPRGILQDLGDAVRAEHCDPAYLARLTLRRIHHDHQANSSNAPPAPRRVAVGGFKRVEELEVFEKLGNFRQFNVTASSKTRYQRALEAGAMAREVGDSPQSEASFKRLIDQRDLYGDDNPWTAGYGQDVEGVIARQPAVKISNSSQRNSLYQRLDEQVTALDDEFRTVD